MNSTLKNVLATATAAAFIGLMITLSVIGSRDPNSVSPAAFSPVKAAQFADDGDATHLAVGHPNLGAVCGIAGGCDAVLVRFWPKYKGSSDELWNVSIPGAPSDSPLAQVGAGNTLDSAAQDLLDGVRSTKAKAAYAKGIR